MAKTAHYDLEKPDEARNVNDEFLTLRVTLDQLDGILWAISQAVAGKAAAEHGHTMAQIAGLVDALNAKMAANKTFKFDDLTDVDGATDAAVGYLLVKSADGRWTPSSAAAAIGVHGHAMTDVAGLVTALNAKANLSGDNAFSGNVAAASMAVDNNGDRVVRLRTAGGVNRGMLRHDQATDSVVISTYNTSGTWLRDLQIGGASPYLVWGGTEFRIGSARFVSDGNVYMPVYNDWLSNVLNSKITADGRSYPRRVGGGDLNFNWSGQSGQPTWVWGGSDGVNMYVYNPSNFNVSYANSAGNADTVDGYHAASFWKNSDVGGSPAAGWVKFPNGLIMNIGSGVVSTNGSGDSTLTFPTAFPTACLSVVACGGDPNVTLTGLEVGGLSTTAFNFRANGVISTGVRVNWIAWGY